MSDESGQFSVGLCHEFEITARKAGWEPKDMASLAHSEAKCKEVLALLRGHSEIRPIDHVIDFDAPLVIPNGWEVRPSDQLASRQKGKWVFDPKAHQLYLAKKQKKGVILGNDLKEDLDGEKVVGAQLLDFYLANPHLIPEEWKGKYTFFWGTIYRDSDGHLCVRYLYWRGEAWYSNCHWLDYNFGGTDPALLAS